MLHRFTTDISNVERPQMLNNPFYYEPDALASLAWQELSSHLDNSPEYHDEISKGKMFGVLVVECADGSLGYLCAFSGRLGGSLNQPFFVPPVFDILPQDSHFRISEAKISAITVKLDELVTSPTYIRLNKGLKELSDQYQPQISAAKLAHKAKKIEHNNQRAKGKVSESELHLFAKQAQSEKAAIRTLEHEYRLKREPLEIEIAELKAQKEQMQRERKQRSNELQRWIFDNFKLSNSRHELHSVTQIFEDYNQTIPPAASGECAGPKLLHYCFLMNYKPLSIAEFWWGKSPNGTVRHHGKHYGACSSKCKPILGFMLNNTPYAPHELENSVPPPTRLEIIFEDNDFIIINKPSGILSVPGRYATVSVATILKEQNPAYDELYIVHRLDQATSGLLLIAKNMDSYISMQKQFSQRLVHKQYIAVLDGVIANESGTISLPIIADIKNRPYQMVSHSLGKESVTEYQRLAIERLNGKDVTRMLYTPLTGRTHQLRLHSASEEGLATPIVGDDLYGTKGTRLLLHAYRIEFTHPTTNQKLTFTCNPEF